MSINLLGTLRKLLKLSSFSILAAMTNILLESGSYGSSSSSPIHLSTFSINSIIPTLLPVLQNTMSSLSVLSQTFSDLYLKYCILCCGMARTSLSTLARSSQQNVVKLFSMTPRKRSIYPMTKYSCIVNGKRYLPLRVAESGSDK